MKSHAASSCLTLLDRSMMWMPLRASKMNGFIFGFHRLVWCPKWTPASNNSFTPILSTIFLLLRFEPFCQPKHPAEHGIDFSVVMATHAHLAWASLRPLPLFKEGRIR